MLELFCSDVHMPHEDRPAWQLFIEVARQLKPDLVFLGGDMIDCYAVSKYDREPTRKLTLQSELNYAKEELAKVRAACPKSQILYLEGNHETRLTRYLHSKAEELSVLDALSLQNLLGLEELGIQWIANGKRTKIGKLWHIHGNEIMGGGANVARSKGLKLGANVIFGHHHIMQSFSKRNYEGETHGAWANGCLCDLEPEYAHFTEWTHSFSVVEYNKTGNFNVEQIPIIKPSIHSHKAGCFIRGKEYTVDVSESNPNKNAPYAQKDKLLLKEIIGTSEL